MSKLFRFAKKCIPNSIKSAIKKKLGIPEYIVLGEENFHDTAASSMNLPVSMPTTSMMGSDALRDAPIKIAIHAGGGMGDYITYIPIFDQILSLCDCTIDFFAGNITYASTLYMPRANVRIIPGNFRCDENLYDLIFHVSHCSDIKKADFPYLYNNAPKLYPVLEKMQKFNAMHSIYVDATGMPLKALRQSKFLNMNRWEFLSSGGALNMLDQRSSILIDMKRYDIISKLGLCEDDYIIVHRGADRDGGGCGQTKVWLKNKYEDFIKEIKREFSKIKIIQIVENKDPVMIGIDCVVRDAELDDVKVVMKCAVAFMGSEGGMAHLAAQLSIPSIVVFGPTPEYYYGYKRNKNIVSPFCSDCMAVAPNWYTSCPRGFSIPKCMEAISGEAVADKMREILDNRKSYRYAIEDLSIFGSRAFNEYVPVVRDIVRKNSMKMEDISGHVYGPVRIYIHSSKRWEYPYIIKQIAAEGSNLRIADVGAGRGALSLYLAKKGHDVVVYDMDYNWDNNGDVQIHNKFMRYCQENRVQAKIATGFNIPDDDDCFDIVICTSVIEHVINKEYMLKEMLRVLKPGGILILTYDLIESDSGNALNPAQIEVLTPSLLSFLFEKIGIFMKTYDEDQICKSRSEIKDDGIEMHPDLTVGGCVIRKSIID